MDCRDCLYCKINRAVGYIRCKERCWYTYNSREKYIKLSSKEKKFPYVGHRMLFNQFTNCLLKEFMDLD